MLLKHFPDKFEVSISHTSRKPRPDEQEGERYFFISPEEFTSVRDFLIKMLTLLSPRRLQDIHLSNILKLMETIMEHTSNT